MEERNESALKLGPVAGIDGGGREGLPYDRLADVGSDEEGDARPESVSFLEELIEEDDNKGRRDELEDEEKADAPAHRRGCAVETGKHVDRCLTESDDKCEHWENATLKFSFNATLRFLFFYSRFCAPPKSALSSFKLKSTSIKFAPARSCMIIPDVTMGVMPNSMSVPRFEARITRIQ